MYKNYEDMMLHSKFPRMCDVLVPGDKGDWKLEVMEIDEQTEQFSRVRVASGHPSEYCPAGKYMRLVHKKQIVMTDTLMERESNREAWRMARGHVLIGGLGLGMVLSGIQSKPEVSSVTVVEKDADLISLVVDSGLRIDEEKTVIVQGDVFEWEPGFKFKYDTLYFDIWNEICADNIPEFKDLRKKYRKYRAKGSWIGFWSEDMIR